MRRIVWIGLSTVVLAGCAQSRGPTIEGEATDAPAPARTPTPESTDSLPATARGSTPDPTESSTPATTPEPAENRPAGAVSQFDTDFAIHSVPYDEIPSGGPPKDGVPAIDAPKFAGIEEADEGLEP